VEVPYWWDFRKETLAATLHSIRSEIIPKPLNAEPIPTRGLVNITNREDLNVASSMVTNNRFLM